MPFDFEVANCRCLIALSPLSREEDRFNAIGQLLGVDQEFGAIVCALLTLDGYDDDIKEDALLWLRSLHPALCLWRSRMILRSLTQLQSPSQHHHCFRVLSNLSFIDSDAAIRESELILERNLIISPLQDLSLALLEPPKTQTCPEPDRSTTQLFCAARAVCFGEGQDHIAMTWLQANRPHIAALLSQQVGPETGFHRPFVSIYERLSKMEPVTFCAPDLLQALISSHTGVLPDEFEQNFDEDRVVLLTQLAMLDGWQDEQNSALRALSIYRPEVATVMGITHVMLSVRGSYARSDSLRGLWYSRSEVARALMHHLGLEEADVPVLITCMEQLAAMGDSYCLQIRDALVGKRAISGKHSQAIDETFDQFRNDVHVPPIDCDALIAIGSTLASALSATSQSAFLGYVDSLTRLGSPVASLFLKFFDLPYLTCCD